MSRSHPEGVPEASVPAVILALRDLRSPEGGNGRLGCFNAR